MAEPDSIRCCIVCGEEIVAKVNKTNGAPSAMPRQYCGRACKRKAAWARELVKPDRTIRKKKPRRIEAHCPSCGLAFVRYSVSGRDAGSYCSRDCYSNMKIRVATERATLGRIAAHWRSAPEPTLVDMEVAALHRIGAYVERPKLLRNSCKACGLFMVTRTLRKRVCEACQAQRRSVERKRYRRTEAGRQDKRICKARRRALERGISADRIDPIKVFERDRWRCHLCGCKTPRRLRGTYEANAPELDHVVPLAAGGAHTWGNVKCACRKCNGSKASRPLGQLGLDIAA